MGLIDREKTMEEIPIDVCDGFEVTDIIEKIPTVPAIPIPEGATNGDMFMIMFPDVIIEILDNTVYTNIDNGAWFSLDWWNAPYKKGAEEWVNIICHQ